MLDRIEFIFGEAFESLRRNTWMTFAAVTTAAVALFLLGGMGLAYLGINRYVSSLPSKFTMEIFLKEGVTKPQISDTAKKIRTMDGVKSAVWISREVFWNQFKKDNPATITAGLENPLPDKFKVTLSDISKSDQVAAQIRSLPTVEQNGVLYLDDERRLLGDVLALLRMLGFGAGGMMMLTSGVLIYNAIRMTIMARRREIRIMQLVGATRLMVVAPLAIEGFVQGSIGGVLAGLMVWSAHLGLQSLIEKVSAFGRLTPFPVGLVMLALVAIGAVYGVICSLIAVRESPFRRRRVTG